MLRIKAKERKQRAMEAKVEDSERKLAEFNARLTVRKNKVCSDFDKKNFFLPKARRAQNKLYMYSRNIFLIISSA